MAYFKDLTPYTYSSGTFAEQTDAVNVGWLEQPWPFETGEVPRGFVDRLYALAQRPINLYRGSHTCWCGHATGNGDIRVVGADGVTYAAPVLVAHYVSAHRYKPPQAFIDAVMTLPPAADAVGQRTDNPI